jgi:hypothetical protein
MKWRGFSWNWERSCDMCQKAAGLCDFLLPGRREGFEFLSAIIEWIIMVTCKCCVDSSMLLTSLSLYCRVYNRKAERSEKHCES